MIEPRHTYIIQKLICKVAYQNFMNKEIESYKPSGKRLKNSGMVLEKIYY